VPGKISKVDSPHFVFLLGIEEMAYSLCFQGACYLLAKCNTLLWCHGANLVTWKLVIWIQQHGVHFNVS